MEDFLNAAKHKIPTLAGMKFTSSDMFDLGCCLCVDDGRFQMLHGGDEVVLFTINIFFIYISTRRSVCCKVLILLFRVATAEGKLRKIFFF